MRVYENLRVAHSEIERDLAKSPVIKSSRVQNLKVEAELREAMNYSYCVLEFPESTVELVALGEELGYIPEYQVAQYKQWYYVEGIARQFWEGETTELQHPALKEVALEGGAPSYTYTDRLRGAVAITAYTLATSPDTRRAYWPIFEQGDAVRAHRDTRIPCSLGYWAAIREIDGVSQLHVTYMQRSCDFRRFWLSDIWFAHKFQQWVITKLVDYGLECESGPVAHMLLSLHAFIEDTQEIY